MLDPELFDQLAKHPDKNAPEVNLALAEEGHGSVLLALARSAAVGSEALGAIARRIEQDGAALERSEEEEEEADEPLALELDRLLVRHPHASDGVRDAIVERRAGDPFFVLAAASHPNATLRAVELAARWPCRFEVLDRPWLSLVPPEALPPLVAEAWAQDESALLREAVARVTRDEALLEALARDASRQVRRAVASNPHAERLRRELARSDPAAEVRARAATPLESEAARPRSVDSPRFVAALAAMHKGGLLAPDVAGALERTQGELDEEGAMLAARVLASERVVSLVRSFSRSPEPTAGSTGLAIGVALRRPEDSGGEHGMRELVAEAAKALSQAPALYGNLTGKARLAAWVADGLAAGRSVSRDALVDELARGTLGGEGEVLARSAACRPELVDELCAAAASAAHVPSALLEVAWRAPSIGDDEVIALARRIARAKRRGQDLPDDEIDLDPRCRETSVLEAVVLAACKKAVVSPRAALAVVALDARRVRYVLTALPQWRGRLSGSMLGRVLRQHAGAISAGHSEARPRQSSPKPWTERLLSDVEMAVALGIGHTTAAAIVERIRSGRHKLEDGVSLASGAEARAVLEGQESIAALLRWAARERSGDGAALALWLLLESYDRDRPEGMIASAVDSLAVRHNTVSPSVSEALALLERRRPGRLERVMAQTPRGKATLASAMARAYRAVGGLRNER